MLYPTWKPRNSPTPPDIMACDRCKRADWVLPSTGVHYHGCGARFRELTPAERRDFESRDIKVI